MFSATLIRAADCAENKSRGAKIVSLRTDIVSRRSFLDQKIDIIYSQGGELLIRSVDIEE
jgi:hypothetical protein